MRYKLLAIDFDGTLTPVDSANVVLTALGEPRMADVARAYYAGLARAKTMAQRNAVVQRIISRDVADRLAHHPLREIELQARKVPPTRGLSSLFSTLRKLGVKTAAFTATPDALVAAFFRAHDIHPDVLFGTRTAIGKGRVARPYVVMTPGRKAQTLRSLMKHARLRKGDVLAVGDSHSEAELFATAGKENSVAFHYKKGLDKLAGHALYPRDGKKTADLRALLRFF